jgi:acetoin utilization protein AcuB
MSREAKREARGLKKPSTMGQIMTVAPHSIGKDQSLHVAHELMRKHRIRHLPVVEHGKLVGVLTERDLTDLERMVALDPDDETVEDGMSQDVYCTTPDIGAREVLREMATRGYECTIVVDHTKIVGIFTITDALELLAEIL